MNTLEKIDAKTPWQLIAALDCAWLPVVGMESEYFISETGFIFSVREGTLVVPRDNKGYQRAALRGECRSMDEFVHRLVMRAFKPVSDRSLQVDHINGNKKDNRLSNLRWCTSKENNVFKKNSRAHAHGMNHPASKLTDDDVREIRRDWKPGNKGRIRTNTYELAKKYDVNPATIRRAARGDRWTHVADRILTSIDKIMNGEMK